MVYGPKERETYHRQTLRALQEAKLLDEAAFG
jgi:hypothetical protein